MTTIPTTDLYHILLVEDDPGDALLVRELLTDTELPHELRWADTLRAALIEAARSTPDCLLVDLHLPDATDMVAVHALREACPTSGVVVLTGVAESEAGLRAVASGAQDYLVKGHVDADQLRRAVRYAVNRKRAEQANTELRENRIREQENARLERGLLPAPLLPPGNPDAVSVTSRYLPSRDRALLGGDFFDVVQTDDGVLHVLIGDVSGHGPDEAALGVSLRISWRALVLAGHDGVDLLEHLERILVAERTRTDVFATCGTMSIDLAARRGSMLLAGHHEPLLLDDTGATPVAAAYGVALGIAPGARRWTLTELDVPAAGALVLYTDGLVEGHAGPGPERLGFDGLLKMIATAPARDSNALLDHLVTTARALDRGRHEDDLAILHISWNTARP